MATAANRRALTRAFAPTHAPGAEVAAAPVAQVDVGTTKRQRRYALSVLGLTGWALVLLLLAVIAVQTRQLLLVRQAVKGSDDFSVIAVYQVESEYLRLRERWRQAAQEAGDSRLAPNLSALQMRYDIWVSRVELLQEGHPQRFLAADPADLHAVQLARRFIEQADQVLSTTAQATTPAQTTSFLQRLLPTLDALEAPLHSLSLSAAHRVAVADEQRTEAVETQTALSLALTVTLSIMTLSFAWIAMRQVHKLRGRRRALEETSRHLLQARREAVAASDAKSTFLANMSHEIRTPFHGLMGMLSLMRETGLTARQMEYLRTATESADHLLALLNDILDMSQLESGRMTLAPAAMHLRAMLREVEALMRPQAAAKALALHFDIAPAVPEQVVADATRLKQILFNLLSNAIKFSDHGAVLLDVHLRASATTDAAPQAEIEFVITDTGIGMDEATVAGLFNRFMQGDTSAARRHGGSGLGLEISRNLARLMRGDVSVRSKVGAGSSFLLRLPLLPLSSLLSADRPVAPPPAPPARALVVLVAEDHAVNRQYMAAVLSSMGHVAHFAANGHEAVAAVRATNFDLVLMDLHMPALDGLAATRAIRALPDATVSTVPIVALTADVFDETKARCTMAGMNGFLSKPVSPQELASTLRRLFGVPAVAAALTSPQSPATGSTNATALSVGAGVLDEAAIAMALQALTRPHYAQLAQAYLEQTPQTVQRLRTAVRDAQTLEVRVNAHAAKGAALNLGLAGLAATAQALQQGAEHLPAHEIARLVQRFEDLVPSTREALSALNLWPMAGLHSTLAARGDAAQDKPRVASLAPFTE